VILMGQARLGAIAVDCADPAALSEFYRAVLDLEVGFASADLVVLTGAGVLTFERVDDHKPPTLPEDVP
jgi:catechol-2,3-dioxygenase